MADSPTTSLDFDRADFSASRGQSPAPAGGATSCSKCSGALRGSYYTLGEQMLCERCHFEVRSAGPSGSMFSRALGALAAGLVAAVIAGGLWLLVTELTGYELGIIALAVGFLVGVAVRIGARGVGGVGYQLLAVFLTYSAIVMTYVPSIVQEMRANEEIMAGFHEAAEQAAVVPASAEGSDAVAPALDDESAITATLYVISVPIAYAAPFLMGFQNVIGILIIGFALYEAWKINKHVPLETKGPFRLGADTAAVG
jgi:hypothetical protein